MKKNRGLEKVAKVVSVFGSRPDRPAASVEPTSEKVRENKEKAASIAKAPVKPVVSHSGDLKKVRVNSLRPDVATLRGNRILIGSDNESEAMAYKVLRTKLFKVMKENKWMSVGITSANPTEGKTTTAINLAYMLEQSIELPVVLVDLDMHRPNVHKLLGIKPRYGIADYLRGEATLVEVIHRLKGANLLVLPGRTAESDCGRLLSSRAMKDFGRIMMELIGPCLIMYDMAPVLAVDDVMVFDGKDCNLVVTAESSTTTDDLATVMELLADQNTVGYVLNKSRNSVKRTRYGYYYYYGYNYGSRGYASKATT